MKMNLGNIYFFVEGKLDKLLIDYILEKIIKYPKFDKDTVKNIGGNTNLNKPISYLERGEKEGKNIIIFDADDNFSKRKKYIENELKELDITKYSIFLFPNNSINGEVEDLLISIVKENHCKIFKCFDKYVTCIDRNKKPEKKSKLFAFLDCMTFKKEEFEKIKKTENYFFDKQDIWDFESEKIKPLIEFLKIECKVK